MWPGLFKKKKSAEEIAFENYKLNGGVYTGKPLDRPSPDIRNKNRVDTPVGSRAEKSRDLMDHPTAMIRFEAGPQPRDPILTEMEKEHMLNEWKFAGINDKYYNKVDSKPTFPITQKGSFVLKDIEDGKPGIRNRAVISKGIVNDLVRAAAKEGVPMEDALATAMRETGIGSYMTPMGSGVSTNLETSKIYDPWSIMMSHNANTVKGYPLSIDQFRLQRGTVPEGQIAKDSRGIRVERKMGDTNARKDYEDYEKYIDAFKVDEALKTEPFRRDMRFLKENMGQKYNPNEKDRVAKLEREKRVIRANPDMYHYADSAYRANLPRIAGNRHGGILRRK